MSTSRDLVRMVCASCDDCIRVPADEVRPRCQKCNVLLVDAERPPMARAHEFAVTELTVTSARDRRTLIPSPSGFVEIPNYEVH